MGVANKVAFPGETQAGFEMSRDLGRFLQVLHSIGWCCSWKESRGVECQGRCLKEGRVTHNTVLGRQVVYLLHVGWKILVWVLHSEGL